MPDSLRLRPLQPGDETLFAAWAHDPDFRTANGWSEPTGESHLRHWRELIAAPPADLVRLAVERDGDVVGYVDLHGSGQSCRELGVVIGPSSNWGRGLGRRALRLALTYAFSVLDLDQVQARTHETNERARRLLAGSGFSETGPQGEEEYAGEVVDLVGYRLERAS